MENYNDPKPFNDYTVLSSEQRSAAVPKKFMANVFAWMFVALGVSALFAYLFATTPSLLQYLVSDTGRGLSIFGFAVMFSPIIFVMAMSIGLQRFSFGTLALLFVLYSIITGISLSFVLLIYTASSVYTCFLTAAAMFGIMAIMGYTTNQDLTSFGRILIMGLVGTLVAVLINVFMHSAQLDYILNIAIVAIFTGLTAYDVQKLKRIGAGLEYDGVALADTRKIAIMGALSLYLDFINIFLALLRLFGKRK
jgi:FtsH-binding integral membrane protein